jgi:hypothetical protein
MKNVTISLPDHLARRARVEAAKAGMSLSRWIGGLIRTDLGVGQPGGATLRDLIGRPGWPGVAADLPKRSELYDRPALRRHNSADLRDGPVAARKTRKGG